MACRSSGFEKRMSKGEGSPSFLRTPTVSTPQCTNTAQLLGGGLLDHGSTRGSCSE